MAEKPYRFSYDEIINILELCAASTESSLGISEGDTLTTEIAQEVKDIIAHKVCWTKGYTEERAKALLPARKEARELANELKLAKEQVESAEKAAKAARKMLEEAERGQTRWKELRRGNPNMAQMTLLGLKSRLDGIDKTLGKRKDRGT